MAQTDETIVWVKTSVLDEAVQLEEDDKFNGKFSSKKKKKEDSQHYGWTLANVVGGYDVLTNKNRDTSGAQVKLRAVRKGSVYGGKTIHVPIEFIRDNDEDVVLMANTYIDSEDGESKELPPNDLIALTHLHEPSVVNCLRRRYEKGIIYTATGASLLSINPFKECPDLYGERVIKQYWLAGESETRMIPLKDVTEQEDMEPPPPHVYGVADLAFQSMLSAIDGNDVDLKTNQTIVVTGESGAGKTVATKYAMEYIAKVCQLRSREKRLEQMGLAGRPQTSSLLKKSALRVSRNASMARAAHTEQRVIESNPILESFGNARTIRNDNSSRFGKFVELQFKESGSLLGATIETYLLEKVRLVHQSPGDRTFHVFYEFLASATEEERKRYLLDKLDVQDFKMTSESGTYDRRDGVDDCEMFDYLVDSLGLIGVDDAEQKEIFGLISAFLHSSNLTFLTINDEESKVEEDNGHLDPVLKLLGLDYGPFNTALTSFSIHVRDQEYIRKLTKAKAEKGLQALMKAIYEALFKHIVYTINENLEPTEEKVASISMLDISGFESFKENSFEQLCINYCNEVLHQQFTMLVFKAEFHEYVKEGIEYSDVSFQDNQEVLDLIDRKGHGIIAILHDQCKVPGTNDRTFATNIYQQFQTNPRFKANRKQKANQQFSIEHYAGPVEYTIDGFVEKNKDEVPKEGSELLLSSSNAFVKKLADIIVEGNKPRKGSKYAQNKGISHQLTTQLRAIRSKIDATSPHYIRCFKPNSDLLPNKFQSTLVADQLRSAGVLEALRVSRLWFAHRYLHKAFHHRYYCLAMKELEGFDGSENEMYKALVDVVAQQVWKVSRESSNKLQNKDDPIATGSFLQRVNSSEEFSAGVCGIQIGNTKVFLRQQTFDILEFLRGKKIRDKVIILQAIARGFLALRKYRDTLYYIVVIQKISRKFVATLRVIRKRKEGPAATKIQSMWRGKVESARLKSILFLAVWVQAHFRGWKGREQYRLLEQERRIEVDAKVGYVGDGEDKVGLQQNDEGTQDGSDVGQKESSETGEENETKTDVSDSDKKEENTAAAVDDNNRKEENTADAVEGSNKMEENAAVAVDVNNGKEENTVDDADKKEEDTTESTNKKEEDAADGTNKKEESDVNESQKNDDTAAPAVEEAEKVDSIDAETDASKTQSSSDLQGANAKEGGGKDDTKSETNEDHKSTGKTEGKNEAAPQAAKASTEPDAAAQKSCCIIL